MRVSQDALQKIAATSIGGNFYRLVRSKYATEPLSMFGAIKQGGRYNVAESFGALYLGFDAETCYAEVSPGILAGLPTKKGAFKICEYEVSLQKVIRLDDPKILSALEISVEEIMLPGNHQTASLIGEPLYNRQMEGLVAPSSQRKSHLCLNIFLYHVKSPSFVNPISAKDYDPPSREKINDT